MNKYQGVTSDMKVGFGQYSSGRQVFYFPDGTEVPESEYSRDAAVSKVLELTNTSTYFEAHEALRIKYNGAVYLGVSKELVKDGYPQRMADHMMTAFAGAGGLKFGMNMGDTPIPVDAI